jgi:hypothetical protein
VTLIDDSLVTLDPLLVPQLASTLIAAIGTGDPEPVIASLANPGLSRRPLCPVHPRLVYGTDGVATWRWTRRARGQWRWDDSVDAPLIEEREAYLVGYGPVKTPHAVWEVTDPALHLTAAERASLVATYGAAALWVQQVGTFDRSQPLLLGNLS